MSKTLSFYKYQGTGNDFIITHDVFTLATEQIVKLCDRKFGIGADGIIFLKQESAVDFDMMYYNADGSESFCGNGSRCAVMHTKHLGWIEDTCTFNSNDGEHHATIDEDIVNLQMHDVDMVLIQDEAFIINTGSPHYLLYEDNLDELDIVPAAHKIRYNETFKETGINVNFLAARSGVLHIRTYERGVEDETLSCGTGVTAAAISHYLETESEHKKFTQKVMTKGGPLSVSFEKKENSFENIVLSGPAIKVFRCEIVI